MPRYKLTIEYDGRPSKGFQAQDDLPSVQGSIERAVKAFSGETLRLQAAGSKYYPENFAGWDRLAMEVEQARARMPEGTGLLADSFKTGAELGFALADARISVLDHPLNRKHGRAPQLQLWGLQHDGRVNAPTLLVVGATDVKFSALLAHYQQLCSVVGPLPPPQAVNIDHGARRFLLFALPAVRGTGDCVTPMVAHIDLPRPGARVGPRFDVAGWAVKDIVGVKKVELTLDGRVIAEARNAGENRWLSSFLKNRSRDPRMPNVQFSAEIDATGLPAGRYRLGLRITGGDGNIETWSEQPVTIGDPGT